MAGNDIAAAQKTGLGAQSNRRRGGRALQRIAMDWSVQKTLLGKASYNDAGQKVGKVDDLIS